MHYIQNNIWDCNMVLIIYIFDNNSKLAPKDEYDEKFIFNEIKYIKVKTIDEIKDHLLDKTYEHNFNKDYIIITKRNKIRLQNLYYKFDHHYIISDDFIFEDLKVINNGDYDVETCIEDHMICKNHDICKIC